MRGGNFTPHQQQLFDLLHIKHQEFALLTRYQSLLNSETNKLEYQLYHYLAEHLDPADKDAGSETTLQQLAAQQTKHFTRLLSGQPENIGKISGLDDHQRHWLLDSYGVFIKHMLSLLNTAGAIEPGHRAALLTLFSKLCFYDMSLQFCSCVEGLQQEKVQAEAFNAHITRLLSNIPELIWSVDIKNRRMLYLSPIIMQFCTAQDDIPLPCFKEVLAEDQPTLKAAWHSALTGIHVTAEARIVQHGTPCWYRWVMYPFQEGDETTRIDGMMLEITEQKQTQHQLENLANTDPLTGLANRTLWHDHLNQLLATARRHSSKVAVMLLDLNHFKEINDTMGHTLGDEILCQVAKRLAGVFRETDTFARLGGDEFAVLVSCQNNAYQESYQVACKMLACFNQPFQIVRDNYQLGASVGIAIYPDHGSDTKTLMACADIAMYKAKNNNEGLHFYDIDCDNSYLEKLQISGQLQQAINGNKMELNFQPIIDLRTGVTRCLEALLRWHHPVYGSIPPDKIIQSAQQSGTISAITEWVAMAALEHSHKLRESVPHIHIAINLSSRCVQNPSLLDMLRNALAVTGMSAENLHIEISEAALMTDIKHNLTTVYALNDMGVKIAVDDFGTGFSSLPYLTRLPIDTLKIDGSFILDLDNNPHNRLITRSIIDLGHNLGIQVIAEGVEKSSDIDILRTLGCDAAQGFHISSPLSYPELSQWFMRENQHLPH